MNNIISVALMALGTGIVLSLITGPVFFALLKTSIERGFKAGTALSLGVFLSDIIYVSLTYLSATSLDLNERFRHIIASVGSVILIVIGTYYLVRKTKIQYDGTSGFKATQYFVKGFVMNFFNPFMFFFWLSILTNIPIHFHYTKFEIQAFLGITLLTVVSSDILKSYLASKWRHLMSDKLFLWLNKIAGSAILIFGIRMFVKVFFLGE